MEYSTVAGESLRNRTYAKDFAAYNVLILSYLTDEEMPHDAFHGCTTKARLIEWASQNLNFESAAAMELHKSKRNFRTSLMLVTKSASVSNLISHQQLDEFGCSTRVHIFPKFERRLHQAIEAGDSARPDDDSDLHRLVEWLHGL